MQLVVLLRNSRPEELDCEARTREQRALSHPSIDLGLGSRSFPDGHEMGFRPRLPGLNCVNFARQGGGWVPSLFAVWHDEVKIVRFPTPSIHAQAACPRPRISAPTPSVQRILAHYYASLFPFRVLHRICASDPPARCTLDTQFACSRYMHTLPASHTEPTYPPSPSHQDAQRAPIALEPCRRSPSLDRRSPHSIGTYRMFSVPTL